MRTREGNLDDNEKISEALRGEVERLAYSKYCDRGYEPGHEVDDWLAAEQELLAKHETPPRNHDESAGRRKRAKRR